MIGSPANRGSSGAATDGKATEFVTTKRRAASHILPLLLFLLGGCSTTPPAVPPTQPAPTVGPTTAIMPRITASPATTSLAPEPPTSASPAPSPHAGRDGGTNRRRLADPRASPDASAHPACRDGDRAAHSESEALAVAGAGHMGGSRTDPYRVAGIHRRSQKACRRARRLGNPTETTRMRTRSSRPGSLSMATRGSGRSTRHPLSPAQDGRRDRISRASTRRPGTAVRSSSRPPTCCRTRTPATGRG